MKTDETLFQESDFRALYDRHAPAIVRFVARKYLDGNYRKAGRLVNGAFRQLRERPKLYDPRYKVRPKLYSLAAERAIKLRQSAGTVAICKEFDVLPCDIRGLIKLVRKGGRICPGLSSRLTRRNYRACIDALCAMLTNG